MLFNSTIFLQFLAGFLLLHYLCRESLFARNLLIVAASYLFYGWWDYRFLGLLIFSSLFDFVAGRWLERTPEGRFRRILLGLSLGVNLSLLGFFKYYDFFQESVAAMLIACHFTVHAHTLGIILPVGISFYTFQSMSYVIDVYRRQIPATRNLVQYLAYVAFFPQLVAGPIQRGHHLLPQLARSLRITRTSLAEGLWLMIWGLFKKVVLADNLAPLVEMVYSQPTPSAPAVILGTIAFALQIYSDFSGYSDIARGIARLLGFDLIANFNLPYWAGDLREFWQRWHISLSTWLRDYLYISLGGSRRGPARTRLNLLLTMLLGGLWHGAAWNFVLWGAWHGAGLVIHRQIREASVRAWPKGLKAWLKRSSRRKEAHNSGFGADATAGSQSLLTPAATFEIGIVEQTLARFATLGFVLYGWLLFRAGSLERIWQLTAGLSRWTIPAWLTHYLMNLVLLSLPLLVIEAWQFKTNNLLAPLTLPAWARNILLGTFLIAIAIFWERNSVPFIYFQF